MPSVSSSSHSSTSEFLKVPGIPGLYRNTKSGIYLGVKKVQGKRKERSLKTTDRKIAERRFKAWIEELGRVDKEVEKTTLEDLFARLLAVSAGKSHNSIDIIEGIRDEFLGWWPYGSKFQVRNVRPSHLEEWLALLGNRVRNSSYDHTRTGLFGSQRLIANSCGGRRVACNSWVQSPPGLPPWRWESGAFSVHFSQFSGGENRGAKANYTSLQGRVEPL